MAAKLVQVVAVGCACLLHNLMRVVPCMRADAPRLASQHVLCALKLFGSPAFAIRVAHSTGRAWCERAHAHRTSAHDSTAGRAGARRTRRARRLRVRLFPFLVFSHSAIRNKFLGVCRAVWGNWSVGQRCRWLLENTITFFRSCHYLKWKPPAPCGACYSMGCVATVRRSVSRLHDATWRGVGRRKLRTKAARVGGVQVT